MKIKRFNESSSEEMIKKWDNDPTIYCVIVRNSDFIDDVYNLVHCFNSDMMAADYIIKYVNHYYNQDFEVYYDNDGNRFFSSLDENEDYELCNAYCREHDLKIQITDGCYHTTPKIMVSI
jgi:hypothetical protein